MKTGHTPAGAGALAMALLLAACTSQHPKASGTTSSARPSPTTTKVILKEPTISGVPLLVDKKGAGSSDLVVLPHSGPLSVIVSCPTGATVEFDMKPDVGAILTCGEGYSVLGFPKVRPTSQPLRIKAKLGTHWMVSVGLGTTV
jgi:hypothetical protein